MNDQLARDLAPQPVLQVRGLGRMFGGLAAVRNVDLDVAHGERRVILGPNGAGKTTLFNLIAGDIAPTTGSIWMLEQDTTLLSPRRRVALGLSRTYQRSRSFSGLTVADNLYVSRLGVERGHLRPFRRRRQDDQIRSRAAKAAADVGLTKRLGATVSTLSHGEMRQLEIAMALVSDPQLLLLDEPTSGLSKGERLDLTDLLLGLAPDLTVLLIEHDMDVALRVADRVTMMSDGEVIVEGTPEEIRHDETVHRLYFGGTHV